MRRTIWVIALLLAAAFSAVSYGDDCECPCAHAKKIRAPQAAKDKGNASHPIAGGKAAGHAVPIEFERVYKINHVLKKGAKDYFSLPLEPGTELTLAMKSLKKADVGLDVIELRDSKELAVASLALSGEVNQVKRTSWKPLKTGRYAVAIGSGAQDLGRNQVIFQATLAPATVECAANGGEGGVLIPDTPREDCFWEENAKDKFHFDGRKNDVYRIEIASSEATADLKATVTLDQKKKSPLVLADASGSGGRLAIESVVLRRKGTYSLEVSLAQPALDVLPYTLTLTKLSGSN